MRSPDDCGQAKPPVCSISSIQLAGCMHCGCRRLRLRRRTVLAVFSGRRIVALKSRVPSHVIELRGSPRGNYVVLGTATGVRVFDARRRDLPRVRRFGLLVSVAWSTDERWLALAQEQKVLLVGPHRSVVLPLHALDL